MTIIAAGTPDSMVILQQQVSHDITWVTCKNWTDAAILEGDAYFNLSDDAPAQQYTDNGKPVFINAVTDTISERAFPSNILRINAWPGFLERESWETAGNITAAATAAAGALRKTLIPVADLPGLVAARVIASVINEACFALGENVSTIPEIDTAMKLGTNYPFGPFEWAGRIGMHRIHQLLDRLSKENELYAPAPEMTRLLSI